MELNNCYSEDEVVTFTYKNYKGENRTRKVVPHQLDFCVTQWHKEKQWFLVAWDIEKEEFRKFAIKDITDWRVFK